MTSLDPITACLSGEISPEVALARLVLNGETEATIRQRLEAEPNRNCRWAALDGLATQAVIHRLRHTIDSAGLRHADAATPARIAEQFDRAVHASPEASVAMYSLGDPSILAAATDEIVGWLRNNDLITPATTVLDLGCGIGRVAAALAPHVRSVHGVDVSPAMIREASRRCAGIPNVHFALTAGTDLAACPDDTFDLVLAVDTFPYLVQAGVAERHLAESRRVLRHTGSLVILNLSYRTAPGHDHLDAVTWARLHGFTIERKAERPFSLWDASCWIFRRNRVTRTQGRKR